jgi:hypothetical protein
MPTAAHDLHNRHGPPPPGHARKASSRCYLGGGATRIVAIWDGRRAKGRELWFHLRHLRSGSPIAAGRPWLSFICPTCHEIREIDLRRLDRHPDAKIQSPVLALSCWRYAPNPPFVKLLGLSKLPNFRRHALSCEYSCQHQSDGNELQNDYQAGLRHDPLPSVTLALADFQARWHRPMPM